MPNQKVYHECCSLGDRLGDDDTFGDLELGNFPIESCFQLLLDLAIALSSGILDDDRGPDLFAILFVGNAKGYRLRYER